MRSISQSEAVATLPALIDELKHQSVVIERDGAEVAVIVTPEEYELIRREKIQRLFESMDAVAESVAKNVRDAADTLELQRTLDRKAS
jgi:PHD/YefM family antitoxin component YafN of YafNO toxin-antitoxin module